MAPVRLIHPEAAPMLHEADASLPPIWKESLWPMEWLTLRLSPVYYGAGVPRGDDSPVVLVPGFLSTDASLYELHAWLGRIGYRPYMSGIGINAQCPARATQRLLATIERAHADTGLPVRIVGHSLGGIIGRRACIERPDIISQLIYLGSPLQGVHAHPAITATASLLRLALTTLTGDAPDCLSERCSCGFLKRVLEPLPDSVRHAAIYTRADGMVDWHDSLEVNPRLNHEVGGTHTGLIFNPRAYRALAGLLAEEIELARAA